jgi:chemotaxis protein methyltransferase CheR
MEYPRPAAASASYPQLSARQFAKIRRLAHDTFGLDLRDGKEGLVAARLRKHLRQSECSSFDEYYRYVVEDSTGEAVIDLIDALTTNHTSFFREPAHFDFLRKTFVPEWKNRGPIHVWSAGCSTGEEPYSIAICLLEALGPRFDKPRILATDISTRALAAAEAAIYSAEGLAGFPSALLRKYGLRGEADWTGWYRMKNEVRALVEFRRLNLLEPFSHTTCFPLIFLRNVMIYFDKPTQRQVVERLATRLQPGGYLLTGHAESLTGMEHGLKYVQPSVYRKEAPCIPAL